MVTMRLPLFICDSLLRISALLRIARKPAGVFLPVVLAAGGWCSRFVAVRFNGKWNDQLQYSAADSLGYFQSSVGAGHLSSREKTFSTGAVISQSPTIWCVIQIRLSGTQRNLSSRLCDNRAISDRCLLASNDLHQFVINYKLHMGSAFHSFIIYSNSVDTHLSSYSTLTIDMMVIASSAFLT